MKILINHLGYTIGRRKIGILQSTEPFAQAPVVQLVEEGSGKVLSEFQGAGNEPVKGWSGRWFSQIDFTDIEQPGSYYFAKGDHHSPAFKIWDRDHLQEEPLSDILHYFKSQRSGGIYDHHDASCPVFGEDRKVDVRGGWYDASGDVSKYLSHLSYANMMNPQQTPLVVWNLLKAHELLSSSKSTGDYTLERILAEATFGGDFLVRMQDPAGYFYMIVFDVWSKDITKREICSYATQEGHKLDSYQAGFRQGGGMAIAALARLSRSTTTGAFDSATYLSCAEKGYDHLKVHNLEYLDDGNANIIDAYCALMAIVELYQSVDGEKKSYYLTEARDWAATLISYQANHPEYGSIWMADADRQRPYFHASDAGLPGIAILEYLKIEPEESRSDEVKSCCASALKAELSMSSSVWNPFGYPRQITQNIHGERKTAFFFPHENESGYWWQGENARVASLAAFAELAKTQIELDEQQTASCEQYSTQAVDWILGLNPFDVCMLDGHGWNNPSYWPEAGYYNAKGGVCNGVTSGFDDEADLAFKPEPHGSDPQHSWRWGEQWIPHGAWLFLAIAARSEYQKDI